MKTLLWIIVTGITFFVCLLFFYFQGLPVSAARLRTLQPGMTTNTVAKLLGTPQEVRDTSSPNATTNDDTYFTWTYESYFHFFVIEVFFDRQGRYTMHYKD